MRRRSLTPKQARRLAREYVRGGVPRDTIAQRWGEHSAEYRAISKEIRSLKFQR